MTEYSTETLTLKSNIASLRQALLDRHPQMPNLLQQIHRTLREYPEQVTLLEEEEIHQIVEGLKVQTGIQFAQSTTKGPANKSLVSKIKAAQNLADLLQDSPTIMITLDYRYLIITEEYELFKTNNEFNARVAAESNIVIDLLTGKDFECPANREPQEIKLWEGISNE